MDNDNIFGITDSLKDLRHKYLEMALLCHPDRGGKTDEMVIIQQNYENAKYALQLRDTSCERLKKVEHTLSNEIPDMQSIFNEIHDIEKESEILPEISNPDSFMDEKYGYGISMMPSMYTGETITYDNNIDNILHKKYHEYETSINQNKDSNELIEPWAQTSIGHALNELSITKETGFSVPTETPRQLPLTDYHSAFYQTPLVNTDDHIKAEQYETIQKERIAKQLQNNEELTTVLKQKTDEHTTQN